MMSKKKENNFTTKCKLFFSNYNKLCKYKIQEQHYTKFIDYINKLIGTLKKQEYYGYIIKPFDKLLEKFIRKFEARTEKGKSMIFYFSKPKTYVLPNNFDVTWVLVKVN